MLRAYSRLFEQLMLVADLMLVGLCWLLAYWLRFYVAGPPLPYADRGPVAGYLLMLLPILLVWSASFRAFAISSAIRSSSGSVSRAPSPPSSAATVFSAEPSKNVSTRCLSADFLAA